MRAALLAALVVAVPSVAHADEITQDNQLVFGVAGTYVPPQNDLIGTDVVAIGHYVQFSHSIEFIHLGLRLAFAIGTGPQFAFEPDAFIGAHLRAGRLTVRFDAGTGPLVNFGDGFATAVFGRAYLRAAAQVRVVKSVLVEAFGAPALIIGPNISGVMAEFGLGAGWNF